MRPDFDCPSCGAAFDARAGLAQCPRCGGPLPTARAELKWKSERYTGGRITPEDMLRPQADPTIPVPLLQWLDEPRRDWTHVLAALSVSSLVFLSALAAWFLVGFEGGGLVAAIYWGAAGLAAVAAGWATSWLWRRPGPQSG